MPPWNPSVFWPAFKAAGMLKKAIYTGPPDCVYVNFSQPDIRIMGELMQTTEYEIEYETCDMPNVTIGETFTIDRVTYTVRSNPELIGNGFFSKVMLTKQ